MMTLASFTRRFVRPLWGWYAGGFFLLAAVNLVTLEVPQLVKEVINALTADVGVSASSNTALIIMALGVLLIVIRALSRVIIFWPGRKIETTTKSYLFERALQLPQQFFLRYGMGDLISRLSNDVGQLRAFYAFGLLQFLNVVFLLIFTITKMVSVHAMLSLFSLLPLLTAVLVTRVAWPRMQYWSRENQAALGRLTNAVTEAFVNVHVIQANAAQAIFAKRTEEENEQVFATNMKLVYVRTVIFPLMTCLAGISQLVVLFYGGREAIAGRLTVGDIMAFSIYIGLLTFPLSAMGIILSLVQRARTALERIGTIDDAPVEGHAPSQASQAAGRSNEAPLLTIKSLAFAYPVLRPKHADSTQGLADAGEHSFDLQDINLSVKAGQKIGLFGKVGSGKSTLFNLITRLFDPPPDTVFFRGQDILTIPPKTLRANIGYALQQVHLFSDSIEANLAFGLDPMPPRERLIAAARGAQILPEIEGFTEGWATQIGEKGVRLSGGQKQRLALARLFVRDQPLLLLDDVLSAVDHNTERRLVDYIDSLGCAMIISSHRGSALKSCDEILVLAEGRVVDRGTFADLIPRWPDLAQDA